MRNFKVEIVEDDIDRVMCGLVGCGKYWVKRENMEETRLTVKRVKPLILVP